MTLYTKVKDLLPEHKSVISDNELLVLDRRDFHITQISPVNAFIKDTGSKVGYPYRLYLSLVDQFISAGDVTRTIVVCDPSLSLAAFYAYIRAGGTERTRIAFPKGAAKIPKFESIYADTAARFMASAKNSVGEVDDGTFLMVLATPKTPADTVYAAELFQKCKTGCILYKDYSKVGLSDERELLEKKGIFLHVGLEGHGLALKLRHKKSVEGERS